jgi:hypothetical protein
MKTTLVNKALEKYIMQLLSRKTNYMLKVVLKDPDIDSITAAVTPLELPLGTDHYNHVVVLLLCVTSHIEFSLLFV